MKQRVLLKGNDAIDLLHRISTLDFKRMPINQNRIGLILNPKGNIVSYFEAMKASNDSVELEFEDQTLEIIDQYTFAEQYEITKLSPKASAPIDEKTRIESLIPTAGKEFQSDGMTNPLEVNLKTAIDDQKGCYPGQEVIEKIISLGSPARRLCLIQSNAQVPTFSLPQKILANNQEVGRLTSMVKDQGSHFIGLAVLKKTVAVPAHELRIEGLPFEVHRVSP